MNRTAPARRRPQPSEEGYILVAVIFMLALLVIAMSVAAPKIAKQIQRDRELETMHRGKQYARAVKLYYKQFGAYPPNVDVLVKTNEVRFLRKKYLDPMTGKDDWKPIHYGQQKTQTMGFFGQPIAGIGGAGAPTGLTNSLTSSTLTPSGGNSPNSSGGLFNSSSDTSSTPTAQPVAPGSTTDPSSGQAGNGQAGAAGSNGSASNGSGSNGSSGSGTDSSSSAFGGQGQTFGGAGIMGFSPGSPKQSIFVYKKKNHYNEWEFLYDPIAEQMMMMGARAGGTGLTPAGTGTPGTTGGSSTFGGGSTFGGSSTFGTSGGTGSGTTTPSPQPQQ